METTVKNVQNGKGEETAACETMELVMESRSENEEFARVVAAVFASRLDPTLEELDDIKTAVSEAVTNAVIHGYRGGKGKITLAATAWEKERLFSVTVRDEGVGIADVEQAMDTIQIVRGNPLLKTYQQFTNSLSYSYSKKQFNANLSVRHQYYDNPIMESIFVEDGKLILKDENQRSFQSLNTELMAGINGATLFGLKDFLTLYASGGYTRSWSEGLNYSHMYDEFYYSVMAQVQYKDFSLLGQFRKVQNNFFGETIKKNENQTAFMAMYTRQNLQAGLGIMFPFTNNYKVGKERISKVAPFRSETFVRETGQMVVLRVGYTFEFGRKHKAGNKGLNNSDTDSGIINMQR